MSHLGLGKLLDAFDIEETADYYRLTPGKQSAFVTRLFSELVDHSRQGLDVIREASGVKLHFVVESDPEQGLSNLPDDVFLRKICFYANRTLVTFPFHETRRLPWNAVHRGNDTRPKHDKDIITFGKYRSGRDGYGGRIEEVRKGHHLLRPEFDAFLHLLCTTRPFLESGDLTILPSYLPEAGKRNLRLKAGLGLISANFQRPELRNQFEENGLKGLPAERRPGKVPYLYLPYFTNLSSQEVLAIRQEEPETYKEFQSHLSQLLQGLPQIRGEEEILRYLREMDHSIHKLVIHQQGLRDESWKRRLLVGAGQVVRGLAVALGPWATTMCAGLGPSALISLKNLKYIGLAQPGRHEHDELYLMSRLIGEGLREVETIPETHSVRVFYGTNCKPSGSPEPKKYFGIERGGDRPSLGYAEVSVPKDRTLVRLVDIKLLDEDLFKAELQNAPCSDVLLFIHGFNVGFSEAVERIAQMAADIGFRGVPIVYSWPARRKFKLTGYGAAESNVQLSEKPFESLLELLLNDNKVSTVHIIAHSMGNRALVAALKKLTQTADRSKLGQVVFAAPDVDHDYFDQQAKDFHDRAQRFTLYGSQKDRALFISKMKHYFGRAGQFWKRITPVEGVDLIDVTKVDPSILGHSYYCKFPVLWDIAQLVPKGLNPDKREGLKRLEPGRQHWMLRPQNTWSSTPVWFTVPQPEKILPTSTSSPGRTREKTTSPTLPRQSSS